MKSLLLLFCSCCIFLCACREEYENNWKKIEIISNFYEDYSNVDSINIKRDSVYIINTKDDLLKLKNLYPSLYEKFKKDDLNNKTILITASFQDYNVLKYKIKIELNTISNVYNLTYTYVIGDPPSLAKPYYRANVCVVSKIWNESNSFNLYYGITSDI